jgi:hypothetical protein
MRWAGEMAAPVALFAILAGAVLSPLLLKRGYPFAFDMSFGPEMKVPPEAFGMGAEFGRRLPDFIWLSLASEVAPPELVVKLLLLAIPFVSGVTAYLGTRSIFKKAGLGTGGALYAALLYELNPFVYQRFAAGHWHILLGYAFFPMMVTAAIRLASAPVGQAGRRDRRRAVWYVVFTSAVLGTTSFAVSVMGLMTLVLGVLLLGSSRSSDSPRKHTAAKVRSVALAIATWLPGNATWLVPAFLKSSKATGFTDLDWRAFLVRGDDQWEALLNVLRLSGFYRDDLAPPSLSTLSGWLAASGMVGLFAFGLVQLYRRHHPAFVFSLVVPALFMTLALGERAPIIGPVLGWIYLRTPGWQIFRESQKLLVPVCFFYAAVGGVAVSHLTRRRRGMASERFLLLLAALLVPFALSPDLFFGLRGRIVVSPFPPGWYEAQDALPAGEGKLLVFPWHQHLPFEFTGGRTNVNPAADFFRKEVVASSRAEFPGFILGVSDPVDTYVRNFISLGPSLTETTQALRPLGTDSIVVLKTADWNAYEFLEGKPGLRKVVDNDVLRLYVVEGFAARVAGFGPAPDTRRVQAGEIVKSDAEVLAESKCVPGDDARLLRSAPFAYEIPEAGCWLIPEVYEPGWKSSGVEGPVWSGAAVGVSTESHGRVVFRPAYIAIGGHIVTASTLVLSAIALLWLRRRRQLS